MNRIEKLQYLNRILLDEMPEYRTQAAQFPRETSAERRRLHRPPMPLKRKFLKVQNQVLSAER